MNPENMMVREKKSDKKTTHYITSLHEMSRIGKSIEKESILVVVRAWERGKRNANRY